jgi:protein involved in polysaccharide export with SLBB domain
LFVLLTCNGRGATIKPLFPTCIRRLKLRLGFEACLLALALAVGATGCAAHQNEVTGARAAQASTLDAVQQSTVDTASDRQRLEELWQKRTGDSFGSDFTLGPGDVIEVSVPLEELEHREVRISPRDTITLPLVGVVDIKGMTEQNLTDTLRQRLSKYMYDPPISLFVSHYGSREVAVMGAVAKPDLYTLASGSDTLMGMISKAGGMTSDAAAKVVLVPGGEDSTGIGRSNSLGLTEMSDPGAQAADANPHDVSDAGPPQSSSGRLRSEAPVQGERLGPVRPSSVEMPNVANQSGLSGPAVARLHPIIIWMTDPAMRNYLDLPARPGDLLIIPSAGQVTVGGWVQNPGAFKISTGMTALSAISAAGGAMFSNSGEVLRTADDGQRSIIPVNISRVQKGEEADIPVQSGDVVMVDKSAAGAVPYFAYSLFSKFGTGMFLPIP